MKRIRVNPRSEVPIYRQVIAEVRRLVAAGEWEAGHRLSSVRELAESLLVNPNTIARAYRDLETLGVIEAHGAKGTFVRGASSRTVTSAEEREYRRRLHHALSAAVNMGLPRPHAEGIFGELADAMLSEGDGDEPDGGFALVGAGPGEAVRAGRGRA
jgi:GntR family transcriptional regulator